MEIFVERLLDKGYIDDEEFFVIVTEVDYKDEIPLPKGMFKFQPEFLLNIIENTVGQNPDLILKVYRALEEKNLYKFNAVFYRSINIVGYDINVKGQDFSEEEAESLGLNHDQYNQIAGKIEEYVEILKEKLTEYFFEFYKEETEEFVFGEEYIIDLSDDEDEEDDSEDYDK